MFEAIFQGVANSLRKNDAKRRLSNNNSILQYFERIIANESNDESVMRLARLAGICANRHHPGRLGSGIIEKKLCDISQHYKQRLEHNVIDNSYLHVLTECYKTGGHTRIAEKWIKFSCSEEFHSVVLTDQEATIPPGIDDLAKETGGKVFDLAQGNADYLCRALMLRELASRYDKIILHTHMYDPIPIVAFGDNDFSRPVVLYNHADHKFWYGLSIADSIIDMSSRGASLTQQKRGRESSIIPVPIDNPISFSHAYVSECRQSIRNELCLPPDSKILLSVGKGYKFKPDAEGRSFFEIVRPVLESCPDVVVLIAGPPAKPNRWRTSCADIDRRFRCIGRVPRDELDRYYIGADIYIDSYPLGGGTAVLEALAFGLPVISVDNGLTQFDSYSDAIVPFDMASSHIISALSESAACPAYTRLSQHLPDCWRRNIAKFIKNLPNLHRVHQFSIPYSPDEYDEHLVMLQTPLNFKKTINFYKKAGKQRSTLPSKSRR